MDREEIKRKEKKLLSHLSFLESQGIKPKKPIVVDDSLYASFLMDSDMLHKYDNADMLYCGYKIISKSQQDKLDKKLREQKEFKCKVREVLCELMDDENFKQRVKRAGDKIVLP